MKGHKRKTSILVISLVTFGIFISATQAYSTITITEGSRFKYAVVCTDYCGSKIWDATYLDADLFFIVDAFSSDSDLISIYTAYNSTTLINRSYTSDYGFFSLNETFSLSTGENLYQEGLYSWHKSNLEKEINVSIPYFFLAHAPSSFLNNYFEMSRISDNIEVSITPQQTFTGHEYRGKWIYTYSIAKSTITVVSDLSLIYDSVSGLLLKMNVEMQSTQDFTGPIPQDPNIEAIGSFKMILVLPTDEQTTFFPFITPISLLLLIILIRRKSQY